MFPQALPGFEGFGAVAAEDAHVLHVPRLHVSPRVPLLALAVTTNQRWASGHMASSPPIPAHLVAAGDALPVAPADAGDHLLYSQVELVLVPLVSLGLCNHRDFLWKQIHCNTTFDTSTLLEISCDLDNLCSLRFPQYIYLSVWKWMRKYWDWHIIITPPPPSPLVYSWSSNSA